jgi:hypothetical protein
MTLRACVSCTGRGRMISIDFFHVKIEQAQPTSSSKLADMIVPPRSAAMVFSFLAPELLLSFDLIDLFAQLASLGAVMPPCPSCPGQHRMQQEGTYSLSLPDVRRAAAAYEMVKCANVMLETLPISVLEALRD